MWADFLLPANFRYLEKAPSSRLAVAEDEIRGIFLFFFQVTVKISVPAGK